MSSVLGNGDIVVTKRDTVGRQNIAKKKKKVTSCVKCHKGNKVLR